MPKAPIPANEDARLKLLEELQILDTELEATYDEITKFASKICAAPISLVSLIDADRQWFKSHYGLEVTETPKDYAFCAHAILASETFVVEDSKDDDRFSDNPLVTGDPHVIFYAGVPLEVEAGLRVGTLCIIDNKPRKLTAEQKEALECLAHQVVTLLRLRLKNYELERLLEEKTTFFANMSHEIRTPMNGIMGMTQVLMDRAKDQESLDELKTINECCTNLLTIINDILDVSKLESGKFELDNHAFRIEHIIKDVFGILNNYAKEKNVTLSYDLHNLPCWISGDARRFAQILMNLLANAIKFSEAGPVAVEGKVIKKQDDELNLQFLVKDQGVGIPLDSMSKLFQPFSQIQSSTARKHEGTGLGLSICKGLVELMQGKIWVESKVGKGSHFYFTAVMYETEALSNGHQELPPQTNENMAQKYPLRILLAEDNSINQMVATAFLKRLGYTVDVAVNGLEVIKANTAKQFDLILMDCEMPEMDGYQATRGIINLSKETGSARPKIIALTAGAMEKDKDKCMEAGMDDLITKPISLPALIEMIKQVKPIKDSSA